MIRYSFPLTLALALQLISAALTFAQWKQVFGSYGGPTQVVIVASHDSSGNSELYAGTDHGPFRSINGQSWGAVNEGCPTFVRAMAANDYATFHIRVGVDLWTSSTSLGVVYTTDHGLNWRGVDSTWNIPNIYALAGCGKNLYVGLDSGLMITSDNGRSWRHCDSIGAKFLTVTGNPSGDTTILALTTSVMRSSDNGKTWTKALPGGMVFIPPRTYVDRPLFALAAHDSFAIAGSFGKVFRSTDDGKSWSASNSLPGPAGTTLDIGVTSVAVDDSNLYASTGSNLFRSTDGGTTWISASNGLPEGNFPNEQLIRSFTIDGPVIYVATIAGVFSTTDHGTTWQARNRDLDASAPRSLAASGNSVYAALGSGYFLGQSSDNGDHWTVLNNTARFHFKSLAAYGSHVIAGTDAPVKQWGYCPAWRSSNYGATWTIDSGAIQVFTSHDYGMNDTYIFAGMIYGGMGLSRCHLDSTIWAPVTGLRGIIAEGITMDGSNLVVGTSGQGIFQSSDNGDHWASVLSGVDHGDLAFNALAMKGSTIFAGTSEHVPPDAAYLKKDGVWRSTDGGATWANKGLSGVNIVSIAIVGSNVLVATDSAGIFVSSNNGDRWWPLTHGLPHDLVSSLVASEQYVYASVPEGIYRLPTSEVIASVPVGEEPPSQFALEQNYPNPFNPKTSIKYTIGVASGKWRVARVKLVVYDLLGREVAVLVNEVKQPGTYTVEFDASGLASGVFLCRMTAGNFVQTRKLCLVR